MMARSDLFDRDAQRTINALEGDRAALRSLIAKLPPRSHRRVELEARLRMLTNAVIAKEACVEWHEARQ